MSWIIRLWRWFFPRPPTDHERVKRREDAFYRKIMPAIGEDNPLGLHRPTGDENPYIRGPRYRRTDLN